MEGGKRQPESELETMIKIKQHGITISLPIHDEEVVRMGDAAASALLLPASPGECVQADAGGLDLKGRLPERVWVQEMNMLAFVLTQFEEGQMEKFQKRVMESGCMAEKC